MSHKRTMPAKPRAVARLYLIASVGVAICCTACGQTGPLTLGEPDGAESDEPEQNDPERDDSEQDPSEQPPGER